MHESIFCPFQPAMTERQLKWVTERKGILRLIRHGGPGRVTPVKRLVMTCMADSGGTSTIQYWVQFWWNAYILHPITRRNVKWPQGRWLFPLRLALILHGPRPETLLSLRILMDLCRNVASWNSQQSQERHACVTSPATLLIVDVFPPSVLQTVCISSYIPCDSN